MSGLLRDVRYTLRSMRRTPGFALVAATTIALGISATTVVFSVITTLVLTPLPVPEPDRLVVINETHSGGTARIMGAAAFRFSRYDAYRDASGDIFSGLAGHRITEASLRVADTAEITNAVVASANYFEVLGLQPALGRFFAADANRAGRLTAVISHDAWRRRFAGDPAAIGRTIYVNSAPHELVGVAPRGFSGTVVGLPIDLWIPAARGDGTPGSGDQLTLFGRLRDEVSPERAAAAVDAIARQVPLERERATVVGVRVQPLAPIPAFARGSVIGFLAMLLSTAGLVLLISSTNVAGMLLARASDRRREIAVRMAIGAGRARLVRQLLVESVLLFVVGGAAGVLLTVWIVSALSSFQPPVPTRVALEFGVDARVLAFALVVALATGVLAGLAPALQTTRADVAPGLRDGTQTGATRRLRLRGGFVVAQLALSLLLVVVAGLFGRTLQKALAADVGFNPRGVVVAVVDPRVHGYDAQRTRALHVALLERVRATPGVDAAAFAVWPPMGGNDWRTSVYRDEPDGRRDPVSASIATIGAGYVEALQMAVVGGRSFAAHDRPGAPPVAMVNQTLARQLWGDASPLGGRVRLSEGSFEVIGVIADGKYESYTEEQRPVLYLPFDQRPATSATLHVRGRMDPAATLAVVRRELAALDPNIALGQAMPLETLIGFTLFPQRMAATAVGIFGAAGLLLAAIGLYGVVAFQVAARTREIGIRVALGAPTSGVIRMVLRYSAGLVLIGTTVGIVCAVAFTRLLGSLLYGVTPTDAVTLIGAPLLLIAVALLASYVPARRATRIDPSIALRAE